jgi:hypothetical protein
MCAADWKRFQAPRVPQARIDLHTPAIPLKNGYLDSYASRRELFQMHRKP